MSEDLAQLVTGIARRARAASLVLATAPTTQKDAALRALAKLLPAAEAELLAANAQDLAAAEANGLAKHQIERLSLSPAKLAHLAESVLQVAELPDPVGQVLDSWTRPNGIKIRQVRVPIGVIGIIYEARPNVTIDCAILCLKSGNASILRGGKEIFHTNTAFAALIQRALAEAGLPADAVQLIPTTDRAALNTMLKLDELIHSTIPVIKHYTGVCFVYVDKSADPVMAERILINAKTQRPGVCNAAEQLLVHADAAPAVLPRLAAALAAKGVQLRADPAACAILAAASPGIAHQAAVDADYKAEFLDLIIAIRIVPDLDTAIATINRDSSGHTDAIITADEAAARRFQASVDSAVVPWNASTRFNDGFEFGFGAEIGISTDRLHARGPMGLKELCSYKYLIDGEGQIRG
jgi:glutamate-5-semialdehyde dehydrogenase